MNTKCTWTFIECLETNKKWSLKTDCSKDVIMTRNNKYDKLFKLAQSKDTICPFCGEELIFYNPYED
ncbi:hypothetical protein [Clostridium lacusfryxellense]|uniref:hypothetical protein n=1 Tax=Clostridium lacusfryxellense TaxID=205328 RepID=UPI001C0B7ADA|nr:hypothetical protein [Clostridium lacusfryxellense]MBU3111983.1 hypothetical protein [Clostridium lacusfryxellense]